MVWHVLVVPDNFFANGKLMAGLNKNDFDLDKKQIKPRRPSLPITCSDLFCSITKIEGSNGQGRYIFHGLLNGWPALRCFVFVGLEQKRQTSSLMLPSQFLEKLSCQWLWKSDVEGAQGIVPNIVDERRIHRGTLRGAPWTGRGWSKSSPGFGHWYEPHRPLSQPQVTYGSNLLSNHGDDPICTHIHML